jgi:Carboxypeptidase regulatory-like domain
VRGRPAITGIVRDALTGRPLAGARVEVAGSARFDAWLGARALPHGDDWDGMQERDDRALTGPEGRFLLVDLPPGRYTVVASLPDAGTRYGTASGTASVLREAAGSDVPSVDLELAPTTIAGTVKGPAGSGAIALARVTVDGSSESTLTDTSGEYVLAALETGPRTVRVAARGHEPASRAVKIATPGSRKRVDLKLGS